MAKSRCVVCNHVYDEENDGVSFQGLNDDWRCVVCNSPKTEFLPLIKGEEEKFKEEKSTVSDILVQQMVEWA